MPATLSTPRSPWPHRWAVLLACATFPLVWWGGFVTATNSGMAFKEWLMPDGQFMPFLPWFSLVGEKFIEHGHRMIAQAVGLLTIGLVVVCYRCEARRWVRRYSLGLLAGVIGQGVLGGMRVVLDERVLALLHGCIGPAFFAAAAGMAAVTSRRWESAETNDTPANRKLARLAVLTAGLAYLQLVLGAIVRHSQFLLDGNAGKIFQVAVYFHVVMAFAVVFHVLWLSGRCLKAPLCVGAAWSLAALIVAQLLLGASSWVVKFGMPQWFTRLFGETGHLNIASDLASATILAAHGAVGALIVAFGVVIAVHARRRLRGASSTVAVSATPFTGAPA